MANIKRMKNISAKCPACAHKAIIDWSTTRHKRIKYECYTCGIDFDLPKGWKEIVKRNRGIIEDVKNVKKNKINSKDKINEPRRRKLYQ
jgi:predicted RNA-binding Zn-ribbon protein involved in translation (DUF1610 family)